MVRVSGTVLLTVFLLLSLFIAIEGTFDTRSEISNAFDRESQLQRSQIDLEQLSRYQIDEENSLRGYLLTRDPFYPSEYRSASSAYDATAARIRSTFERQQLNRAAELLADYTRLQIEWRESVARPLFTHPRLRLQELDKRNKLFSDYEALTAAAIRRELNDTGQRFARTTQTELDRSSYARAAWVLVFGLLAIVFNVYRSRLNRELEEERTVTAVLQRAFRSESIPLPHCQVGSAYLSATSHLAVGGDVFDVYKLSENRALLLIADISGKGLDAAVLTAFVKFMVRAIALRDSRPSEILREFNVVLAKAVGDPYLFASMFLGVLDTDTFRLTYASAGHDAAYLRGSNGVAPLKVTGPVLGVMEEPYGTETVDLRSGDALVLATDGLTEVRNPAGEQLLEQGAMALIANSGPEAQRLADEVVAKVRVWAGRSVRDDLAVLVVRRMDTGTDRA